MNSAANCFCLPTDKKFLISSGVLAFACGMGMGAAPAEAILLVTPVNQTVGPDGHFTFGPKHNNELTIYNNSSAQSTSLFLELDGNTTALSTNSVAVKADIPGADLRRFNPGEAVDPLAIFHASGEDIILPIDDSRSIFYGLQSIPDPTLDPFGWIQITAAGNSFTVLSYAFQDNATQGAQIPTGVPEPGTLSLFAVRAAAVIAARHLKRAINHDAATHA